MKKGSSSFLVLFFAALLVSFQSFAQVYQDRNVINERVQQNLRMGESLRLSDLLRLSMQEQNSLEIISLSLIAQSFRPGAAELELLQHGRPIASEMVRRQLNEVRMIIPAGARIEDLELATASEVYLESITAEVRLSHLPGHVPMPYPEHQPGPQYEQQVSPHSLITLHLNQRVHGYANISLDRLARQQLGLSLEGAQIERVIVQGLPGRYGRSASVQVELNHRPVGQVKYLSPSQRQLPLQVQSWEEVRSLSLIVNGDAEISQIRVRVGAVRPVHQEFPSSSNRIIVRREVSQWMPLELSSLLPRDHRLISSITVHAHALRNQSQLNIMGPYGELQGAILLRSSSRATIRLKRPMAAHEIRIESHGPAIVDSLEIEFNHYSRW